MQTRECLASRAAPRPSTREALNNPKNLKIKIEANSCLEFKSKRSRFLSDLFTLKPRLAQAALAQEASNADHSRARQAKRILADDYLSSLE
jgi:hypothetical protein